MSFDPTIPDGDKPLNLVDDDHRANAAAIQAAMNKEHDFNSGGTQSGRHKFQLDLKANIDAESEHVNGSVAIATDAGLLGSTKSSITWREAGAFTHYFPMFQDEKAYRTKAEWHAYRSCNLAGGIMQDAVTASAWNWEDSNLWKVTISANMTIPNPVGANIGFPTASEKGGTWILHMTMGGTGSHTLTFGSLYEAGFDGELMPPSVAIGSVSILYCTLQPGGSIFVNLVPAIQSPII